MILFCASNLPKGWVFAVSGFLLNLLDLGYVIAAVFIRNRCSSLCRNGIV